MNLSANFDEREWMQTLGAALDSGRSVHDRLVDAVMQNVASSHHNVISKRTPYWNRSEQEYLAKIDQLEEEQMRASQMPTFDDPIALPTTHTFLSSHQAGLFQLWRERRPRFPIRPRSSNTDLAVKKAEALIDYQAQRTRIDKVQFYRYIAASLYGYSPRRTMWNKRLQTTITYAWDPYQFFWDPYYPVEDCQRGQFVAFQSLQHRVGLIREERYFNLDKIKRPHDAFLTKYGLGIERETSYKAGTQRDSLLGVEEPTDFRTRGIGLQNHIIHEMYWWMIPKEFFKPRGGEDNEMVYLPGMDPERPVIAVITIANGETLIGFDYLDHSDARFPAGVIAPLADGHTIAPPGLAELNSGIQQFSNWAISSFKEDTQRNINGIWFYDPSKIRGGDLRRRIHGMNVAVRKQAYGTNISEAIWQVPVQHVTRDHIGTILTLAQMQERDIGATDIVQGASSGDRKRRTAREMTIQKEAAQGRYGALSVLYDQQDSEDLVLEMYQNARRYMRQDVQLRLTGDIAELAKLNPRVNTHFSVSPNEFENVEIDYVPFDPKVMAFREKSADIKRELLQIIMGDQEFRSKVNVFAFFRGIVRDLGEYDFDIYLINQPGPVELSMGQQEPNQGQMPVPGPVPAPGPPPLPPGAPMPQMPQPGQMPMNIPMNGNMPVPVGAA